MSSAGQQHFKLSLIVPMFNEENHIAKCIKEVQKLSVGQNFSLEIILVDDASTDNSPTIAKEIAAQNPNIRLLQHGKNQGKGAALRTGLIYASGDFVGIQDADMEYDPMDYLILLEPLLDGRADVVYGSRYLKPQTRRVLYFWHTWMNKMLTKLSNMFTNLDISDMETCYKLFSRKVIADIAPKLKENRFGFEPEITARVAQGRWRVYESAVSYNPRTFEEGKKIGWKDGVYALYCILHYGANSAPVIMQVLLYFFIGFVSLAINLIAFIIFTRFEILTLEPAIVTSIIISSVCNYLLCVAILFRHKARWNTALEIFWYAFCVLIVAIADFALTKFLISKVWFFNAHWSFAKLISSSVGFVFNFYARKMLVFYERKKPPQK